ncbi:MAG: PEGA domain-containing protein [Planctomycetota bacterium]|jgi:hypothetical protein
MRCGTSHPIIRSAVALLFTALACPRAATAQGRCQLLVISRPGGATVSVGGEERGKSPLTLAGLKVGKADVKVVLEGYYVWTKRVQLRPGGNTVEAKIEKRKAPRAVSPPAPKGGGEGAPAGAPEAEAPADETPADETPVDKAPAGRSSKTPPRKIPVPCPCCEGKGVFEQMNCPACGADGYDGIRPCAMCRKTGRVEYVCPLCAGMGSSRKGGKDADCRLCGGKGHPPCPACKAKGTVMRPNPEAVGYPTIACAFCGGTGLDQNSLCTRCDTKGEIQSAGVGYYLTLSCYLCGGDRRGPKVCNSCQGLGQKKKGGRTVPCTVCYASGRFFHPCKQCSGLGWHKGR